MSGRTAVYTAIFGAYDDVPDVSNPDPRLDYLLFTDGRIASTAPPWQIRPLPAIFSDPQRDARRLKALPHLFLPEEYALSVWLDANCEIRDLTDPAIRELIGEADIAVPGHAERQCTFKEADALLAFGLYDSPAVIARQMRLYETMGLPRNFGLHHNNFLVRRHTEPRCIHFCTEWWQQISSYSKRDQLSFDFVRWKLQRTKVKTLPISYDDNHLFCCTRLHKSPRRIVSEHLEPSVRCNDLAQPFLACRYQAQYDVWPPHFLAHLRRLNEIAARTGEPLDGNLCYFHHQKYFEFSPPDPRRGARREAFLRALAGRSRIMEIGFGAGHSTLLALSHSDAMITAIDDGARLCTPAAAAYLHESFGERMKFFKLDSRALSARYRELELSQHDMIHINGGRPPDVFAHDITTVLNHTSPGTLIFIDDIYVAAIKQIIDRLVADRLLAPYGNLETRESGAYMALETAPRAEITAESALLDRLLSVDRSTRTTEETPTPFLEQLLLTLDADEAHARVKTGSYPPSPLILRLDGEFTREIGRIGYHPFVLVRNALYPLEDRFLVCHTQNEIAEFANRLTGARAVAESELLHAIERALQEDIATAAKAFFSWASTAARQSETIYLGLPRGTDLPSYFGYPIFEIGAGSHETDPPARVRQLTAIFEAYHGARGNDRARLALLESLAVALARWWGIQDELDRAAEIIARVLRLNPTSTTLRRAINALDLRSRAAVDAGAIPHPH